MNEMLEIFTMGVGAGSTYYAPATLGGDLAAQSSENKWIQTAAKTLQSFNTAQIVTLALVLPMDAVDLPYRLISPVMGSVYLATLAIPAMTRIVEKLCPQHADRIAKFDKHYGTLLKAVNVAAALFGIMLGIMVGEFFTFPIIIVINTAALASSGYALAKDLIPLFSRQPNCL